MPGRLQPMPSSRFVVRTFDAARPVLIARGPWAGWHGGSFCHLAIRYSRFRARPSSHLLSVRQVDLLHVLHHQHCDGMFLAILLFWSAPLLASFYTSPGLVAVIRWLSLPLFLGGLRSASQSLITKKLLFRKLTIIEGACSLGSAVVAVYLAWRGFGVWNLVTNIVLGSSLNTVVVVLLVPPTFTLRPDMAICGFPLSAARP